MSRPRHVFTTTSSSAASTVRRKGPGPRTYKPTPAGSDPPVDPPLQSKPWNYHNNSMSTHGGAGAAGATDKSKPAGGGAKSGQKPRRRPEWDPNFWKTETQLKEQAAAAASPSNSKGPPSSEVLADIFESFPKLLDIPEVIREGVPPSWREKSPEDLRRSSKTIVQDEPELVRRSSKTTAQSPERNDPKSVDSTSSSSDTSKHPNEQQQQQQWNNYHKWWETLVQEVPSSSGKGDTLVPVPKTKPPRSRSRSRSRSKVKSTGQISVSPAPVAEDTSDSALPPDADEFIVGLADVSELVEFLLYKCAAEECLPMLPEVLQDLDSQFRTLVTKYLYQKREPSVGKGQRSSGGQGQRSSPLKEGQRSTPVKNPIDQKLFLEVSEMHEHLKSRNEEILKTNDSLMAEVENLKSQVQILQEMVEKQELVEDELRSKVTSLQNLNRDNENVKNSPLQHVTIDMIQLKAENEALKLLNSKLRHETELNDSILGILELKCLCQNYHGQEQGTAEVKGRSKVKRSVETTNVTEDKD